jgi:alcohol dehydrogenase (cytochrome c)
MFQNSAISTVHISLPLRFVRRLAAIGLLVLVSLCAEVVLADGLDWVGLNKDFDAQRYVELDQINKSNLKNLKPVCEARLNEPAWFGSGIVKVDRTLYVTTLKATYAIDAVTCKPLWRSLVQFKYAIASYFATRGVGYAKGVVYRGTNDGQLIALEAKTGKLIWAVQAADSSQRESLVAAPVVWNDKLFIGVATSDKGINGRLLALDVISGKAIWQFKTVQMNNEQGGGFWTTVSLDKATGEVIAPVSNPTPIFYPEARPGDNVYTNSVISVDAASGKLNWYYQAVPHDEHDWDLSAAATLYRSGAGTSMLAVTGKSGRVYGYDRTTQAPVFDVPATTLAHDQEPLDSNWKWVCPGAGAQYNGTAYDPRTGLIFVGMVDWCRYFKSTPPTSDTDYAGGSTTPDYSALPEGRITGLNANSGQTLWRFQNDAPVIAGLVTTKSGLLFAGDVKGRLLVFDATTGALQQRQTLGGAMNNGLISYSVGDKQYLAAAVGGSSITTDGVAGPLRVAVLGLTQRKKPEITSFPRISQSVSFASAPKALFMTVCSNCHGQAGTGALYPSILRHSHLADLRRLEKFLASVPDPMPKLYPGLLNQSDVRLIANYLRTDIFKCGRSDGQDCKPHGRPVTGGTYEWRQIYSVLTNPRCQNCHTASDPTSPATNDYPRQTDDRRPHLFGISRGADDKGLLNGRCDTCHGKSNNPQTGAPGVEEDGQSGWFLAPTNMAMEISPGTPMPGAMLCSNLKNPDTNGGFTLEGLLKHLDTDVRVNWAWSPGVNSRGVERTQPPISHERFVRLFGRWIEKGAPCPKTAD